MPQFNSDDQAEPMSIGLDLGQCPEFALLMVCASPMGKGRSPQIDESFDWQHLFYLAKQHKLVPIVYKHLKQHFTKQVPTDVLLQFKRTAEVTFLRNQLHKQSLIHVLNCFAQQQIDVIALKGLTIAEQIYRSLYLRPCGDLDLWVAPKDYEAARTVLVGEGYQALKNLGWKQHLVHPAHNVNIDLHQALLPDFFHLDLRFTDCKTVPLQLGQTMAQVPSPEDLLLLLSIMVFKDCYQLGLRLVQLCDMANVIQHFPELDWTGLLVRSQSLGCQSILLFSLALVQDLYGLDLPDVVQLKLSERNNGFSHSAAFQEMMTRPGYRRRRTRSGFLYPLTSPNHLLYIQQRERLQERMIYAATWLRRLGALMGELPQKLANKPIEQESS